MMRFELVIAWSLRLLYYIKKTNSTQKFKLLNEISRYDLYYFITSIALNSALTKEQAVFLNLARVTGFDRVTRVNPIFL